MHKSSSGLLEKVGAFKRDMAQRIISSRFDNFQCGANRQRIIASRYPS